MGFLRAMPAITIPLTLWLKVLKDQVKTLEAQEFTGRITAVRQWLRILEDLTYRFETNFPNVIQIDVTVPVSAEPYYIGRYYQEQVEGGNGLGMWVNDIYDTIRLKKGFDHGVLLMQTAGQELMDKADEIINDLLYNLKVLDPCKINVLKDAGILDMRRLRALVLRKMAKKLLDELPRV
jgi:hypothetical protein